MVMLQSLAEVYPSLCVNNPHRVHELIRSYQNRPAIATALVWALGQGGRKDLGIGLRGRNMKRGFSSAGGYSNSLIFLWIFAV